MIIKSILPCLTIAVIALLIPAQAQTTQTWDGGAGTWDVNNTPNWDGGNVWTNDNDASFGAGTGTVTMSDQSGTAPVTIDSISINDTDTGDGYTFAGSSLTTEGSDYDVTVAGTNTANITFENQFVVNATLNAYFGNDQSNFTNNSAATVTYGAIDIENANGVDRTGSQIIGLNQTNASGTTVVSGAITAGTLPSGLTPTLWINLFGSTGGTYEMSGSLASGFAIQDNIRSTLLLNTSSFGTANINVIGLDYTNATTIETVGSQTISNTIGTQNDTLLYIGGSTAGTSNFDGTIDPYAELYLTAAAGGRVNINSQITNHEEAGLNTTGDGTVALNNASGNSYDTYLLSNYGNEGTVAATLGAKMTIINNTTNNAFGNTSANTVNLLANSGLGGNGITTDTVVATDGSSVIAPGDGNIGTLTIAGITASNGLTMNFKLNGEGNTFGTNNDFINVANLTLGGTVTINLTAMDALQADTIYTLAGGSNWTTGPGLTFDVETPAGYALNTSYGTDGVMFNDNNAQESPDTLSIELIAVPEPSAWLMIGCGALALGWAMRRAAVPVRA